MSLLAVILTIIGTSMAFNDYETGGAALVGAAVIIAGHLDWSES